MRNILKNIVGIFIQGLGPLSIIFLSIGIVKTQGVAIQGEFASTRALIDLVVAIGLFGLPQSIVLHVNRDKSSRKTLYQWGFLYGATIFLLGVIILLVSNIAGYTLVSIGLVFSAALMIVMGIMRSIFLTVNDGVHFNFLTAFPTLCIVNISFVIVYLKWPLNLYLNEIFVTATTLAMSVYILMMRKMIFDTEDGGLRPNLIELFSKGADVFFLTVCNSLQIYFLYHSLLNFSGPILVGHMSIVMLVLNAINFPLQSLSPMLLNQWSKNASLDSMRLGGRTLWLIGFLLTIFIVFIIIFLSVFAPRLFAANELPSNQIWLLLITAIPALFARISALKLTSIGEFRFNSKVSLMQLIIFSSGITALVTRLSVQPELAAVIAWVTSETIAAAALNAKLRNISLYQY